MQKNLYQWAVVGAGPAGIAAVGQLLDHGVEKDKIIWLDPEFDVGDLGKYWSEVSSNTKVALFTEFLRSSRAFQYEKRPHDFNIESLNPENICILNEIVEPLRWVTHVLTKTVPHEKTKVRSLKLKSGAWELSTSDSSIHAKKIILATGAIPKVLNHEIETIDLETALKPSVLKQHCSADDIVAIFGSSHSAMIIIRSLIEAGVKKVINFYRSPIRYAIYMDNWTLYDNTGLKGETAKWTHENIAQHCLPQIERYHAVQEQIDKHLPECNKTVYAVGFESRHIACEDLDTGDYDTSNGIIAPGLFGFGIAYPQLVTDPFGNQELNVGIWKFLVYLQSVLPIWMRYEI